MKRILLWGVLAGLGLAVVVAGILWWRRPAPRAADLLPGHCLLFANIPNLPESRAQFAHTAAAALWCEPEVRTFLEPSLQALRQSIALDETATALQRIADDIRGEVFLAVTHVRLLPRMDVGIVFGADFGRDQIQARAALAYYERQLQKQTPGLTVESPSHLGVKYKVWKTRSGSPICHAFLNSLAVFTVGEDTLRDLIARRAGISQRTVPALSDHAGYRRVANAMPEGHEGFVFFNTEEMMKLIGPLLLLSPQTSGAARELAHLQAVGTSLTFDGRSVEDLTYVSYQTPRTNAPPLLCRTLALTTPQTLLYMVGTPDLTGFSSQILEGLMQSGHAKWATVGSRLQQELQRQGIRLQDVFRLLGPEMALVVNWREGAPLPDAALVAEVRDAEKTRSVISQAMAAFPEAAPWEESFVSGETLRSLRIGDGTLTPSYAVTDRFFILALTPDFARELLAQADGSKPTLATRDTYRQATKPLPGNGISYGYCDVPTVWERCYPLLAEAKPPSSLPVGKLPSMESVRRHLFPFAAASVAEERAERRISFSPFSPTLAMAGGLAAAVVVARSGLVNLHPSATKRSSGTDVPPSPPENPTAASRTPPKQ